MTESFDSFNAPQFFDFSRDLHKDENVDSYFEIDHENIQPQDPSQDPLMFRNSEKFQDEDGTEFYSPLKATPRNNNGYEDCYRDKPRRSMSVGDLKLLIDDDCIDIKKVDKVMEDQDTSQVNKHAPKYSSSNSLNKTASNRSLNKDKTVHTRTSALRLSRAASKENLDRLAQPKKYGSAQNLNQSNYVTMAEAVRKFQSGTPTRFRSKPKMMGGLFNKLGGTVPQSPALMTKNRHRPVHAVSREEQERLDYEEAQKFKIKANPLNKKILQGPIKPLIPVEKKPSTVIEPFNITEVSRKIAESPKKETFEFHAKPIPKAVYEGSKLKEVQKISVTKPQTPTFMKRYTKEPLRRQESQEEIKSTVKLGRTTPVPFSFESRDQQILKKKEKLIQKVMEEEKKAREFHARPIPKAILSSAKNNSNLRRSDPSSIHSELTKSEENITTQFKARPPTVLYKKPFEPKKERHLIEITEFQLNTEKRAKEREEFEQLKREKEEKIALAKQLEEELRLQKEEEEVARLRKEAEYKAQPVKKYKEIKIQPSGKMTEPKSPNFYTDRLRNKENKENSN